MARAFRDQAAALARAFLARFFENEITRGADDLKSSFFWLAGVLTGPGIFIPLLMAFDWSVVGMTRGHEVLQAVSRGDKAFYLGLGMVVAAIVSAVSWNSLLPDRRDGLILGALPVRAATIVAAKLAALGAYVGLVGIAMHAAGSLLFGFALASGGPFAFLLRGIAGHLLASFAATAFVLLSITSVLGILLVALGPRLFARASPVLQAGLAGMVVLGLWALPVINTATVPVLAGGAASERWILHTPPLWFLGLYEWMLGTSEPLLLDLARIGAIALAASLVTTGVIYPLAYRRVMVAVVQGDPSTRRARRGLALPERLAVRMGPAARLQAVTAFYLTTIARSDRHRFVVAIGFGLAAAWSLPALLVLSEPPRHLSLALLSQPLAAMAFIVASLRIAAAIPADLRAGWLFESQRVSRLDGHRALERLLLLIGVAPVLLVFVPLYWRLFGPWVAVAHGALVAGLGALLIELALWRFDGGACARAWDVESARLGRLWPAYLVGFLAFTLGAATLSLTVIRRPVAMLACIVAVAVLAAVVRVISLKQPLEPAVTADTAPGELLGLH
jgi:hypothetical protein